MSTICIHAVVTGTVQGVFYRDSTKRQAQQLNLSGWVKNNVDGSVELVACGEKAQVEALVEWLWQGSPAAVVENVVWEATSNQTFHEFKILR